MTRLQLLWLGIGIVLLLICGGQVRLTFSQMIVAGCGFAVGMTLRVWSATARARVDNDDLITIGPYAWVRHPRYVGSSLAFFAYSLYFEPALAPLVAAALSVEAHRRQALKEESDLTAKFGPLYTEYMLAVPRWLPRLVHRAQVAPSRSAVSFSFYTLGNRAVLKTLAVPAAAIGFLVALDRFGPIRSTIPPMVLAAYCYIQDGKKSKGSLPQNL